MTDIPTPSPAPEKKEEDWVKAKWRPVAAWIYMVTCTTDFIIFPVLWSILQASMHQQVTQWNPITLQGAGLYHLAMGAILGVAAWSRGQEKMASMNSNGMNGQRPPMTSMPYSNQSQQSSYRPMPHTLPDTDMEDADRGRGR